MSLRMRYASLATVLATIAGSPGCDGASLFVPVGPGAPAAACLSKSPPPWSRKILGVGGAVTFNEIMYRPAGDPKLEWVELYNPLAIDVDLSGFRIGGAIQFTVPDGTMIGARGLVVVASNAE